MPLNIKGHPTDVATTNRWALGIENQLAALKQQTHSIPNIAKNVVLANPPAPSGGGLQSVGLVMPNIFTVTGSPVLPPGPGPLTVAMQTETPGTFLGVGGSSLGSLEGLAQNSVSTGSVAGTTQTLTATPNTATSWGLYVTKSNITIVTPPGWTQQLGSGVYTNSLSGTAPVNISQTVTINSTISSSLAIFGGAFPTIVQSSSTNGVTPGTASKAFSSNNTAGNTLLLVATSINNTFGSLTGPFSLSMSDSAGNIYSTLSTQTVQGTVSSAWDTSLLVMLATNCIGGANTVTLTVTGRNGGSGSATFQIFELSPIGTTSGVPFFRPLVSGDIPPINVGIDGNGGVTGILRVRNGGTGADLSSTGGASQVLKQTSSGGVVTVAQLAASDLSNGTTGSGAVVLAGSPTLTGTVALPVVTLSGKVTNYNGIATVSDGVPAEYATVDLTAQTAAVGTTTLYAVPASGAGQYRVSWNSKVTTVAGTSSTIGPLTITYTDPDSVVQTITAAAQSKAGVLETSDSGNVTTTILLGLPLLLNCKASTNIQYAFAYASNAAATMQYNLHIKLEAL